MLLHELVETSRRLSGTTRRLEKIEALAGLLVRLAPDEIAIGVAYLSGTLPQGRIGIGPAAVRQAFPETASPSPSLELSEVHKIFSEITTILRCRLQYQARAITASGPRSGNVG